MRSLKVKKSLSSEKEHAMQQRFLKLCAALELSENKAANFYQQLYDLYNEPTRHYHNLVHIWNFLNLFDDYSSKIDEPLLFELAIWYHDAIYIAKNKDNELQSAVLVKALFSKVLSSEQLAYIDVLIMSTAGHFPKAETEDVHYFLDFDLAILAADQETYQLYSEAIWEEYKTAYPRLLYKMGRKKVLKNFLARKKLYFSDAFYQTCEKKARQNIQLELNA